MTANTPGAAATEPTPAPAPKDEEKTRRFWHRKQHGEEVERIIIRTYPKVVFLYPTMIMSLICAIFLKAGFGSPVNWGHTFLIVLAVNLCVLAFDFPRTASLTLVFSIIALILAALMINERVEFLPKVADWTGRLQPSANATFYWLIFLLLLVLLVAVYIIHRYVDYWEVLSNELIHHHGILGGIERIPAPGIKLEKEITDVFEYLLLQSGRLVITPQGDNRAIVLDTVPNINKVEDTIKAILGVTEVSFRQANPTLNPH